MAVALLSLDVRMGRSGRSLAGRDAACAAQRRDIASAAPLDPASRPPYGVARLIYQSSPSFHDRRDSGMVVQVEEPLPAAAVPDRVLDRSLADTDPEVHGAISAELIRQQTTLE